MSTSLSTRGERLIHQSGFGGIEWGGAAKRPMPEPVAPPRFARIIIIIIINSSGSSSVNCPLTATSGR
jgi:hypothetical protein